MSITVTVNGQSGPTIAVKSGDQVGVNVGASSSSYTVGVSPAGTPGGQGPPGPQGAPATTITVANTTTLAAGANATVTATPSNNGNNLTLSFGIPTGPAGPTGAAGQNGTNGLNGTNGITPTFSASASTLSAGSNATVNVTSTNGGANVALAFGIPQGAAGGGSNLTLSDSTPSALGTAAAGSSSSASRADHVHQLPVISYANLSGVPSNFPSNIASVTGLQSALDGKQAAGNYLTSAVTSVNNLTGALTLAAGANVTLTANGSTLTIAASGGGGGGAVVTGATVANFPATGTAENAVYVATDSRKIYGWEASGGGVYVELGPLAAGAPSLQVTIPAIGDPHWLKTQLLMNADGGEVADISRYTRAISLSSATATGSPKYGNNSILFSGSSSYAIVEASAAWGFPADFTFEAWVYLAAASPSYLGYYGATIVSTYPNGGSPNAGWWLRVNGNADSFNTINLYTGTNDLTWSTSSLSIGQWHHVAVCRADSVIRAFVNGVQQGSWVQNFDPLVPSTPSALWIGRMNQAASQSFQLNGRLDDLRLTSAARYAENFTPPAAALPTGRYQPAVTVPCVPVT